MQGPGSGAGWQKLASGKGLTAVPVDSGFGKGEILGDPTSSFVDFIILQFGGGGGGYYYSLEKGRRKNVEELDEDS